MFIIKFYNKKGGTLKEIISKKNINSVGNYTKEINGSLTTLNVSLFIENGEFISIGDYVEIFENGNVYYKGFIFEVKININGIGKEYNLNLLNLFNFLSNFSHTIGTKTQKQAFLDLISFSRNDIDCQDLFDLSNGVLDLFSETETINLGNGNLIDLFKKIFTKVGVNFFIDVNEQFIFTGLNINHFLIFKKHIDYININQTNNDIIKNENIQNQIELFVNNSYNINEINPTDTLTIKNLKNIDVDAVEIAKVVKNQNGVKINLLHFDNFVNLIKNL